MNTHKDPVLFIPLKVLLGFLVFTEVLLFYGPNVYELHSPALLVTFLIVVNLSFYLGYKRGVSHFHHSKYHFKKPTIQIFLLLGLVLNILRMVEMWGQHGLNVSLNTIILALLNPGDAYFAESMEAASSSLLMTLLSPITWAALPFGLYKWKELTLFYKIVVLLIIIIQILSWLGIGTRKGLMDIILLIGFISFLNNSKVQAFSKLKKKYILWIVVSLSLFLSYFVFSNLSRYGFSASEINQFEISHEIRPFYQENLPHWLIVSLSSITGYLCQGYYALSIALSQGIITPTFLGMSLFTMVIATKFGLNPMPDTYMALIEPYGIDPLGNWHTIYVWLANDFTFIGVPFIIFLIGMMLARTWYDCIKGENDLAIPLFSLFLIMVFYFFANNQVLSFSFMPFVTWWLLYHLSRSPH